MSNIDKLNALLRTDEAGEELASLLSELLFDTRRRNVLLVKLNEIRTQMSTLREVRLTRAEEMLRSIVLGARKPPTVQEITAKVGDEFQSLKHVSHASVVLNSLVSKGVLGKFKFGYNYHFTSPKEAVNEQLKRRDEIPQECSPAEIAKETAMPLAVVLDAIEELLA
ncbi:hypothetical protein ES705_38578 [subsurface metagenome]